MNIYKEQCPSNSRWERSGSVVECLTRDRRAAGLRLASFTALCPWARHISPSLVLIQPSKTRPDVTERLLTKTYPASIFCWIYIDSRLRILHRVYTGEWKMTLSKNVYVEFNFILQPWIIVCFSTFIQICKSLLNHPWCEEWNQDLILSSILYIESSLLLKLGFILD